MTTFEVAPDGKLQALPGNAQAPEGAYTTFRTYGGSRVLRPEQHLARLWESADLQGLAADLDAARFERGVGRAIATAALAESRLRVTYAPPRLLVSVWPFEPLPAQLYETGARCLSLPARRVNPHAKDTRFLAEAAAAYAALPAGVHEGLMFDATDGALLEGLSSNFFAVLDGQLRTENERVLRGVTRGVVLELAAGLLPVRLEPVRRGQLARLDEAFLTSVSRGVLAVASVDGRPVGGGRPGPVALALAERLRATVEREARQLQSM
jgi:branched-chain amino acid aminotransferase